MVVTTRALAKINLHLAVHGRRADGYHDLTTVFQAIALDDAIDVRASDGPFVLFSDSDEAPADSTNLVWRAASLIADAVGRELSGVRIELRKQVPIRAGLGGGSADAMATMRALQAFWGVSVPAGTLERLASQLGADVAFFLRGGTALGTGRGDQVMPLPDLPAHHVVIVRPPLGVATSAAYEWLADARRVAPVPPPAPFQALDDPEDWRGRLPGLRNDFEPVVARRHPEIAEAVERLRSAGADHALMSGSGSAVAGLFRARQAAQAAAGGFGGRQGWRLWLSRTVGRAEYLAAVRPRG